MISSIPFFIELKNSSLILKLLIFYLSGIHYSFFKNDNKRKKENKIFGKFPKI